MFDYHLHSHFSVDSEEAIISYIHRAEELGVKEFCLTDHLDLDTVTQDGNFDTWNIDFNQVYAEIDRVLESYDGDVKIKKGVEMGLMLHNDIVERSVELVKEANPDFVLLSLHVVDDMDAYFPEFFDGLSKQEGYFKYLNYYNKCVRATSYYNSIAHIDYPIKGCPYDDNALSYSDAPDQIDSLFEHLIKNDKCIEINGSIILRIKDYCPDINIYKRYVELGGEYITLGSDAHSAKQMAQGLKKALEFAKSVGIKYIASYDKMQKQLHKIEDIVF